MGKWNTSQHSWTYKSCIPIAANFIGAFGGQEKRTYEGTASWLCLFPLGNWSRSVSRSRKAPMLQSMPLVSHRRRQWFLCSPAHCVSAKGPWRIWVQKVGDQAETRNSYTLNVWNELIHISLVGTQLSESFGKQQFVKAIYCTEGTALMYPSTVACADTLL